MADRTVKVNLLANVIQYERSVNSAADATDDLRQKAERFDGKKYKAQLVLEQKEAEKSLKDFEKKMAAFRKREAAAAEKAEKDRLAGIKRNVQMRMDAFWKGVQEQERLEAERVKQAAKHAQEYQKAWDDALKEKSTRDAADVEAAKARVDTSGARADLAVLRGELAAFDRTTASAEANLDIDKALLDARRMGIELDKLDTEVSTPEADLKADELHRKIQVAHQAIRRLNEEKARVVVTADTSRAVEDLSYLKRDLNALNMKKARPEAEVRVAKFHAQIASLERELMRLGQMEASADVDLRTAEAHAKIVALNAELRRFNGKTFTATADVQTHTSRSRLGALIAAISAVTPAIAGMAATGGAAIAGLSGTLAVAAAGAGVAALAFSGIGDAVEAMNKYALDPSAKNLKKLNEAMAGLNETQKQFARFIVSDVQPAINTLQNTAADGMLPGVKEGLQDLLTIMPQINGMVKQVSEAMGEMASRTGEALKGDFWKEYIAFIGNEAKPQLLALGEAFGKLIEGIAAMQMAFAPFTRDIVNGLRDMANEFANWAKSLEGSKEFEEFLAYVRDVGPQVIDTFGSIAGAIIALVEAGMPLAPFVLGVIRALADLIATVAGIPYVGTALIGLAGALGTLNLAFKAINAVRTSALVTGLAGLAGAGRGAQAGLTNAAGAATTYGGAATRAATSGGRFAQALRGIGGSLPIIGAALIGVVALHDGLNTTFDEATDAMSRNGVERTNMINQLRQEDQHLADVRNRYGDVVASIEQWHDETIRGTIGLEEYNRRLNEQRASMAPLERAQSIAQQAQLELNDAINQFGPGSAQAAQAARNYANAQADVQVQTQLANKVGQDYFNTLKNLIAGGGDMGAAAERVAAGLNLADLAAMGAKVSINGVGQAVATMPDGKQIVLTADGQNATFQVNMVNQAVQNVPLNRTVNVGAIGEPAQAVLRQIGFEVTTLPDGTVTVTARDEQARAKLAAMVAFGNEQRINPTLDANSEPGRQRLAQLINEANASRGLPAIDANSAEGRAVLDQLISTMNSSTGTSHVNAESSQGQGVLTRLINSINGAMGFSHINAEDGPGRRIASGFMAYIGSLNPIVTVTAILQKLFGEGDLTSGIQRTVHMPMANGGVVYNAPGNSLSPYNRRAYNGKKLTNLPNTGAQMVKPNTWRVVGDRMDVPELYAPLDGSGRSLALIAQGAKHFGKTLVDSEAIQALTGAKWQSTSMTQIPKPVNVQREMATAGASAAGKQVTNNVTINNPIAERGSDSVQSRLSRLADLGLFGDD